MHRAKPDSDQGITHGGESESMKAVNIRSCQFKVFLHACKHPTLLFAPLSSDCFGEAQLYKVEMVLAFRCSMNQKGKVGRLEAQPKVWDGEIRRTKYKLKFDTRK